MVLVYEIMDINFNEVPKYSYEISTEAIIFRDKTFPSSNYTMSHKTLFKGDERVML